ncbi:Inhibin beta E chain [Araneus ventricosus]|uniref:Inhibin beta E chain n=1 Tax=Araneus ventricosus TaxID=182803 RepID=A0A4Y2D7B5_ARAVE|nr:Inhibin beta E chain [Araneus ventricosus]GBM13092.1 Inhibin beta E chain [Araneus ventricosus]
MGAKVVIYFILLSLVSWMVEMTPISMSEDLEISGNTLNDIEDLFFISEKEEESFEKDALNNAVIEKVKARILNRLNLKEPPKSHPPIPALQRFDQKNNSWSNAANSSTNSNAKSEFLKSEIVPNTCFHQIGPQCLRFQIQIPQHILNVNSSSAELWLYKKEGVTEYTITHIIDDPLHISLQKEFFSVLNQTKSAGWTRLDVTALMSKIRANVLDLEVFSNSVDVPLEFGNDKNPLLVVISNSVEENRRSKRHAAVDCEVESSSCCRKVLYVSFKDIGWDNWIVQPEGYNANACKGSCKNRLDLTDRHHTHVILRLISKSGNNYSDINDTINCSPKAYSPLSIIYTDDKGLKVITNLPDMSVSECACS